MFNITLEVIQKIAYIIYCLVLLFLVFKLIYGIFVIIKNYDYEIRKDLAGLKKLLVKCEYIYNNEPLTISEISFYEEMIKSLKETINKIEKGE